MDSIEDRRLDNYLQDQSRRHYDPHENGLSDIETDLLPDSMGDNGQIGNISRVFVFGAFLIES
jgi:hypothetical protein